MIMMNGISKDKCFITRTRLIEIKMKDAGDIITYYDYIFYSSESCAMVFTSGIKLSTKTNDKRH